MHDDFALNIKVERRKKGLSQRDVAHLIGVHPSKVSLMEAGKMLPSLRDIAHLSLVYGKSFEEFFYSFVSKARESITTTLAIHATSSKTMAWPLQSAIHRGPDSRALRSLKYRP